MSAEAITLDRPSILLRDYSAEFKIEALARVKANNGNVYRTAKELDIPEPTLRGWVMNGDRYRDRQEQKIAEIANKLELNLHRLADDITEADLTAVPFGQKVTAIGILTDKMLLLRGQPTSIVATTNSDLNDLLASVAQVAQVEKLSEHDAALRLAAQLADVPELAAMLREWAAGELERRTQQGVLDQGK